MMPIDNRVATIVQRDDRLPTKHRIIDELLDVLRVNRALCRVNEMQRNTTQRSVKETWIVGNVLIEDGKRRGHQTTIRQGTGGRGYRFFQYR